MPGNRSLQRVSALNRAGLLSPALLVATSLVFASAAIALDGYLAATDGVSSRWTNGDRNDPIGYLVDADALPSGVTTNQALAAVSNALNAWANASSLMFRFDGFQSFGMPSAVIYTNDTRIRIQLHDLYGYLPFGTAGHGGRGYEYMPSSFPDGGVGGRVSTNEFDRTTCGFVVIDHTDSLLQNTQTLAEILCHELGHSLSLDHSSELVSETDPLLKEAIMYYRTHNDGRGATLNAWDIQTVQVAYPTNNTPPYGFPRVIDAITASPSPACTTGVNQVEVHCFDRQDDALTLFVPKATTNNGTFTFTNHLVSYVPFGLYNSGRIDPASSGYYDVHFVRASDGTNLSPPVFTRVLSYNPDVSPKDGLPDTWASTYGVTGATNDPDHDGISNLFEWHNNTNPTNAESALSVESIAPGSLVWQVRPYEVYEIQAATNIGETFERDGVPFLPSSSVITAELDTASFPTRFFRIRKVP